MRSFIFLCISVIALSWTSCDTLSQIQKSVEGGGGGLTESEIISGLKEALKIGTNNAATLLNKENGFFGDPLVKIPFPPDAQRAADKLRQIGMTKLVDDFVMTLNRGAEKAAKEAGPIFGDAITSMTISDARNILNGPVDAATQYFKGRTTQPLYDKFQPVIKTSLDQVNCTKYWTDVTSTYNKIPLVTPVETDLPKYATNKALDGLFLKLAGEEQKIRQDPAARVTALLQKVFGSVQK